MDCTMTLECNHILLLVWMLVFHGGEKKHWPLDQYWILTFDRAVEVLRDLLIRVSSACLWPWVKHMFTWWFDLFSSIQMSILYPPRLTLCKWVIGWHPKEADSKILTDYFTSRTLDASNCSISSPLLTHTHTEHITVNRRSNTNIC